MSRIVITPANADEHERALALLFSDIPIEERPRHVARALEVFASGEVDPAHLLVARLSPQGPPVASMFAQIIPGATALVWPPRTEAVLERGSIEKTLLRTLLMRLREQGVKLVQSFLAPEDGEGAVSLLRNGFHSITRIRHMRCDLTPSVLSNDSPQPIEFLPFEKCDAESFQHTLLQTYEASLDCPELNDLRTPEEVLTGFRVSAPDPSRWWLLRRRGEAVGVLVLADGSRRNAWDLSYLGIVAAARGQGFGRIAVRFALERALQGGMDAVTLIVDERNAPALALYQSFDFRMVDVREVFLLFGLQQ